VINPTYLKRPVAFSDSWGSLMDLMITLPLLLMLVISGSRVFFVKFNHCSNLSDSRRNHCLEII